MVRTGVLAGPILRRAESDRVLVWLATSGPAEITCAVHDGGRRDGEVLGEGQGRSVRLGPGLHVHLVAIAPAGAAFPSDRVLGYDLRVDGQTDGILDGLTYPGFELPTFFIRGDVPALNLLHGSCRLLHGPGADAFVSADDELTRTADDLTQRPQGLFLTGDQIYGDEVGGPLIRHLTALGRTLLGAEDSTSVPGLGDLDQFGVYERQQLMSRLGFTSGHAANHLFSMGEYMAMYLVAWHEENWPARFPSAREAVPHGRGRSRPETARLRRHYASEADRLTTARDAVPAARRVLANVPVHMTFDDHDVTDDWNITREWREQVYASPAGRRVVAGALAAFWAFQGWGNEPRSYDQGFIDIVAAGPQDPRFDETLWSFDRWSYVVPTDPPTIVLDTRTQRRFDNDDGAARLLGDGELRRIGALARDSGIPASGIALLVSPVPVFGLELQERRQKYLVGRLGPYEIDFEAWHSNLQGFVDFMHFLIDDMGLRSCVILSGDVHYAITVDATFASDIGTLHVAQLVSSSFKHSGTLARLGIHMVGAAARGQHQRVGWDAPPTVESRTLVDRILRRPVNTDQWAEDAPVFLSPAVARRVRSDQPPRYTETRRYVLPRTRRATVLIGDNNIGVVRIAGDHVSHRLLAPTDRGTATHPAELDLPHAITSAP